MKKDDLNLFIPSKAPNHRQKRLGEEIRSLLSSILLKGDLPVVFDKHENPIILKIPITVIDVDVSPDLSQAQVFIMPLMGEMQEESLALLQKISWFFRKSLSKKLSLHRVPHLTFRIDKGFAYSEKIDKLL